MQHTFGNHWFKNRETGEVIRGSTALTWLWVLLIAFSVGFGLELLAFLLEMRASVTLLYFHTLCGLDIEGFGKKEPLFFLLSLLFIIVLFLPYYWRNFCSVYRIIRYHYINNGWYEVDQNGDPANIEASYWFPIAKPKK